MFGIQNFCNLLTSLHWWRDPWTIQTLPEVTLQELIPQKETILQCKEENHHFPQKIIVFNQLNLILLLSTYYFSIAFVLVFERRIKISFYAKNQCNTKRVLWLLKACCFACYDFGQERSHLPTKIPLVRNCLGTYWFLSTYITGPNNWLRKITFLIAYMM